KAARPCHRAQPGWACRAKGFFENHRGSSGCHRSRECGGCCCCSGSRIAFGLKSQWKFELKRCARVRTVAVNVNASAQFFGRERAAVKSKSMAALARGKTV